MKTETKKFPVRVLLTVTTGCYLIEPNSRDNNGIGALYDVLEWMTGEAPFTHSLPRFANECKPHLMLRFREVGGCSVGQSVESLKRWIASDHTHDKQEGVRMWLAECRMLFPELKDEYEVPKGLALERHKIVDPVAELIELRESREGLIVVKS